jgi:molecular chaperone DnaK
MEKINEAWKVASEEMYKAQQETQAQGTPTGDAGDAGGKKAGDNVEDVDFEEVKE